MLVITGTEASDFTFVTHSPLLYCIFFFFKSRSAHCIFNPVAERSIARHPGVRKVGEVGKGGQRYKLPVTK